MPESPLVSVIIPNWNGLIHLQTCLDSLASQTYEHIETIIVDNASTDGSQEFIRSHYPDVRLLALNENQGFTGAVNAGIRAAHGDIIALLNNDTETDSHWIAALVDALQRHPEAGAAASKILLFDRRDTLHTAGDFYSVDGMPGNRGVWQLDNGTYAAEEFVFSACGGAAAYRKQAIDQVGLFEERFFFSGEDVDMGWRLQLAGFKTIYVPDAIVYHHLAATGGDVTASFYNGRNYLWIIARNYPGGLLRKYFWAIVSRQWGLAREAIKAWRGQAARARLRGMLVGLISLPSIFGQRRAIQRTRSVSTDYLETILEGADTRE